MMASTIWAWIGVGFFAAGSLAFMLLGVGSAERNRHHFVTSFIITLIALCSYLSLAFHQGTLMAGQAGQFGYGRYVDWALTTPLLLMGLITLALPQIREKPALVVGIIFSDVFMIVTGIFAGLSDAGSGAKWIWYILSCGAFVALYFLIWGPMRATAVEQRAQGEELLGSTDPEERYEGASYKGETSLFYKQAGILSVLWFFYPIVFLVSAQGLNLVPLSYTSAFYTILDVSAKVGFGLLLLIGVRDIERNSKKVREEVPTDHTQNGLGSRQSVPRAQQAQ